jgi:ribosomal protein S18 acetylase RimI-like enzyme
LSESLEIREAKIDDFIEIIKIAGSIPISSGIEYRLQKYFEDKRLDEVYVCEEENKVIGFVWIEKGEGEGVYYIRWLSVAIPYQGKGIGKKLLSFIEEKFNPRILIVETMKDCPAEKFYEKNGFKKVFSIEDFYAKGIGKSVFIKYF